MKKRIVIIIFFIFFLLINCPVFAQFSEDIETSEIFAPFVSRLKATVNEGTIVLTWNDSVDITGKIFIYRHSEEISSENFNDVDFIGIVESDVGSFVDKPPTTNPYYYAVLVQADEKIYEIFIPFRNKTIISIKIPNIPAPEIFAADITNINAVSGADQITITFDSSVQERELIMYRSNSPITQYSDLFNSISWVLEINTEQYIDIPPAGIGYYYALLDAELVKVGDINLVAGANSTKYAVILPITEENQLLTVEIPQHLRARPLPYLMLQTEIESGNLLVTPPLDLPDTEVLSPASSKAVAELLSDFLAVEHEDVSIQLLEVDKANNQTGEEYILNAIIKEELLDNNYYTAISSLLDFISIHRPENLEIRAHFYLAQAYYFTRDYRKATLEFLIAKETYLTEVTGWIDACLAKLIEENNS